MLIFKNYLVERLPEYIKQNDSYKNGSGKGFVVRFIEILGEELDDYTYLSIEEFTNELSVLTCNPKYLDYYAFNLGDVLNLLNNTNDWRYFLSYLLNIYKVKGTKKSYQAVLGSLGLGVTVVETTPTGNIYDAAVLLRYDETVLVNYDTSCEPCSSYSLLITGSAPLTGDLFRRIKGLVQLVEPINAQLSSISYNGDIITAVYIEVIIDVNGNLVYDNTNDPDLVLTLENGDLIISGPNASQYYLDGGDLYYIF